MNGETHVPSWALPEGSNEPPPGCVHLQFMALTEIALGPAVTYDECRLFSRKKNWSWIHGDRIGPGDQGMAGVLCNLKLDCSEALRAT